MPARAHFRAFERRELTLPASVAIEGEPPVMARLANVGLGGACLEVEVEADPGERITLEITTPILWDPLVLAGRIAWSQRTEKGATRFGMRFDHERPSALRALVELLAAEDFE